MVFKYEDFPYIIGIDFGTTFSGTCYCIRSSEQGISERSPTDSFTITGWPHNPTFFNQKMPSIVVYDKDQTLIYWGGGARGKVTDERQTVIEKFKLYSPISLTQKGAVHQIGNSEEEQEGNIYAEKATEDYFTKIYDHTLQHIKEHQGKHFDKEKARFVITVPASWNEVQRKIMRNVAKKAGIISDKDHENRLLIINESLAATLYCERDWNRDHEGFRNYLEEKIEPLKLGDKYIVCDAGGGTVDLATFECTEGGTDGLDDSFRRCQLTADGGQKCGSTYLDENMKDLLLSILFGSSKKNNDQGKALRGSEREKNEALIDKYYMKNFIMETKVCFGEQSQGFKCKTDGHTEFFRGVARLECVGCVDEPHYSDATSIKIKKQEKELFNRLNFEEIESRLGKPGSDYQDVTLKRVYQDDDIEDSFNGYILTIPYTVMKKKVFDQVVEDTIDLLRQQISKSKQKVKERIDPSTQETKEPHYNGIKHTYLVGGFGRSKYLCKKILKAFLVKDSKTKKYEVGELVMAGSDADLAAMKGATYFGDDGNRRESQREIVKNSLDDSNNEYDVLVCLDIGYNGTSCSYRSLRDESQDMTKIEKWLGAEEERIVRVPTAKEKLGNETLWGAQVKETVDLDPKSLIMLSELMSTVKKDLREYLKEYLKLVFKHVQTIITADLKQEDVSVVKYRYVITMENCFKFFNNKSDMRRIAKEAGLIDKDDPMKRLLLIHRENAAALYYEEKHLQKNDKYSDVFLQVNMYHNICHLTLHESIKVSDQIDNNIEVEKAHFRNVRTVRAATFSFNFISRLVNNLDSFVSTNTCIICSSSEDHDTYSPEYYTGIRAGFLKYIKNELNFDNSDQMQKIEINTKDNCCKIHITIYDLLEYVFRPTIRDLASEINRSAAEVDIALAYVIDKVFISGILLDTFKEEAHILLERILIKYLAEAMNLETDIISFSVDNGEEALIGAARYGNNPYDFTERVARKSYVVNLRAYAYKLDKNSEEGLSKDDQYNFEARHALINEDEPLKEIHQEFLYKPSIVAGSKLEIGDENATLLFRRGDKISEQDQTDGIVKKFYTYEDCIVYATIFTSEENEIYCEDDSKKIDLLKFQKIHRFEVYVKKDPEDPMANEPKNKARIPFEIRFFPDNNEAKFEANLCSRLGEKNPEFRFRDEFLVANIFDDSSSIPVGDLRIKKKCSVFNK